MPMDHEGGPPPKQDRLKGLAPELGPPFFLFSAHRDVGRRIMGEEDAQVVPREQVVQHPNPAAVLLREVRQVLPLPPGWAVEAPQAPDHPDLPSSDRPPLGRVLQEPPAMRPRAAA